MVGAERTVIINDKIKLDFSWLFAGDPVEKKAPTSPLEPLLCGGLQNGTEEQKSPAEGQIGGFNGKTQETPEQAQKLLLDAQRELEDHQRNLAIYKAYQESIKRSERLQSEILRGLNAGEDVYSLFLKAVEAVSLMTADTAFFTKVQKDVRSIYGKGLNYKPPLQIELQDAQKRLQRLSEAEKRETQPDSRERITRAIKAHRKHITELEDRIARA